MKRWLTIPLFLFILVMGGHWLVNANKSARSLPNPFVWLNPEDFPPLPQKPIELPQDHDGHPMAPMEIWQLRGILLTGSNRKIAFQLHVLALSLTPHTPQRRSPWAARRYFFGYFTRTDADSQAFQTQERGARAVLQLAGAEKGRVWVDDWSVQFGKEKILLQAGTPGRYLRLTLQSRASPVLSENPANLRYYRMSRLEASGQWGMETVEGFAWLEHGWGQLPLPGTAARLQRFQIRLGDGRDLACVSLRISSKRPARLQCRLNDRPLQRSRLEMRKHWRDENGTRYPVAWRLMSDNIDLDIEAVVPGQKLSGPLPVWSGWVIAKGEKELTGEGFVQVLGHLEE